MKINHLQKLGILQALLSTFNAIFQNEKKVPQFIVIKVYLLHTLYISSIIGGDQASQC